MTSQGGWGGYSPVVAAEHQVVESRGHLVLVLLHELRGVVDHLPGEVDDPERRLRARTASPSRSVRRVTSRFEWGDVMIFREGNKQSRGSKRGGGGIRSPSLLCCFW